MRYSSEQQSMVQSELGTKVKNMEEQLTMNEAMRNELRDRLRVAEDSNKELTAFMRSL